MRILRFLASIFNAISWLLLLLHFISLALASERSLYIVHMDKSSMPRAFATHHNWYSSAVNSVKISSHPDPPKLVYSYDNLLHGFSAVMTEEELESLKKSPGFVSAYKDRPLQLHTTYTPQYLKLNSNTGLWPASKFGQDVIIGVIDTGVWPESESFSDRGMPEIPKRWKGICREGKEFNSSLCNRKLIGANYFNDGLKILRPGVKISMNSARDTNGHGSHTASTAAGNYVEGVSYRGYAPGIAKGVAPRAQLAVYKALWNEGASGADLLAAINQAVKDGVNVISISAGINAPIPVYEDPIAIAAFGAVTNGVFFSASAGNSGPTYGSLENSAPWILTVAAGSTDRGFTRTSTYFGKKPAPTVADFSSMGPSRTFLGISKPDIMAPGVMVLAAVTSGKYAFISGTSMACPHASGIAAMLKSAHPDWSPSAIRSAMMTTAVILDNTGNPIKKSFDHSDATPLDMGAGLIHPNRALDPGLIYDVTPQDYMNHLCSMNFTEAQFYSIAQASPREKCSNPNPDLNYPSFIVLYTFESENFNWLEQTFKRTVTNVGPGAAKYKVKVQVPKNSKISIFPKTLTFGKKNEKQSYTLKIRYRGDENQSINMGSVTWVEVDGYHKVRSPIVVAISV